MPEDSRRIFETQTLRISKTANVPLKYAFDWCTDFRSDDGQFSTSKPRFTVMPLRKNRVARIRSSGRSRKRPTFALELIRLRPPNAWHVDQIDETDLASVDYRLTRVGPRKTRITLSITERWMTPKHPARQDYLRSTSAYWDVLVAALDARYASGLPPRGR